MLSAPSHGHTADHHVVVREVRPGLAGPVGWGCLAWRL
jgi:hypothetical protein